MTNDEDGTGQRRLREPTNQRVLIVGGGLAGLAAASVLAPRGFLVTLLESRPRLGGRASSFEDPKTGELVDNCQHVTMGCCTNLADFCRRVGVGDLLSRQKTLYFQNEAGAVSRLRAWPLPAPLHLAPGLLTAQYLSLPDKLRIAWGTFKLMRTPSATGSFRDWLMRSGQTERTCERYWGLILTSALNESLDRIDFRYARQVFIEGFLWNRSSFVVEIPSVSLGEFYGARLEQWLEDNGVNVRYNSAASSLEFYGTEVTSVTLRDGSVLEADNVILAVPFGRVTALLGEARDRMPEAAGVARMESSPITSVHLWYDRPVMDLPHLVPVGRTIQWLFRRTDAESSDGNHYVQAVISASRDLASMGKDRILENIHREAAEILPRAREARLLHTRVVTEKSATYSVAPGIDGLRPPQKTSIRNLWLAGDYTDSGWPATMEGAVRSGYLAAESLLAFHGMAEPILTPPLPASWLTRLLVRDAQ